MPLPLEGRVAAAGWGSSQPLYLTAPPDYAAHGACVANLPPEMSIIVPVM